jgi:hypothetical protein
MHLRTQLTALPSRARGRRCGNRDRRRQRRRVQESRLPGAGVQVFAPQAGDVAGRQSIGFFVDPAFHPSLDAGEADFQLTGPTTHQNQAPFPGAFETFHHPHPFAFATAE